VVQKMSFESYLLGHWTNVSQAQSDPLLFSSVELVWDRIPGGLRSKNFYRKTPNSPYRERYHKINQVSDTKVIVENYHTDWTRSENCDMMFVYNGEQWIGSVVGDSCISSDGNRVHSEMKLFGSKIHTCDQGYDSDGNMIWGSKNHNMIFDYLEGDSDETA